MKHFYGNEIKIINSEKSLRDIQKESVWKNKAKK